MSNYLASSEEYTYLTLEDIKSGRGGRWTMRRTCEIYFFVNFETTLYFCPLPHGLCVIAHELLNEMKNSACIRIDQPTC